MRNQLSLFYSTAVQKPGNNVCPCLKFDIKLRLMSEDDEDDPDRTV